MRQTSLAMDAIACETRELLVDDHQVQCDQRDLTFAVIDDQRRGLQVIVDSSPRALNVVPPACQLDAPERSQTRACNASSQHGKFLERV